MHPTLSKTGHTSRNPRFPFYFKMRRFLSAAAAASGEAKKHSLIVGCGSNVMDLFYKVRQFPKLGDKQYFEGTNPLAATVVGGEVHV